MENQSNVGKIIAFLGGLFTAIIGFIVLLFATKGGQTGDDLSERAGRVDSDFEQARREQHIQTELDRSNVADAKQVTSELGNVAKSLDSDRTDINRAREILERIQGRSESKD